MTDIFREYLGTKDVLSKEELEHCNRCGLCLAVCPTYRDTGLETFSPRGRLALIRAVVRGELITSPNFADHIYHCLDCYACDTVCPSGIKIGQAILSAREIIERGRPQPRLKSFILNTLLTSPEKLELSLWGLRLYQKLGVKNVAEGSRLLRLLPGNLDLMSELLPPLPPKPLRCTLPSITPSEGEREYRVGFFLGCTMNVLFASISEATIRILAENGCEVITPLDVKCCGAPHIAEGEKESVKMLARHNIDAFQRSNVEQIITDCAACGAMLKDYGDILSDDAEYAEKAMVFSQKVRDISEFLIQLPLQEKLGKLNYKVTYHDPCHLAHSQGITSQPRELLGMIPGVDLVELEEASWCCGSAGIYNLTHTDRSMRILENKMQNIGATKADFVATGNPGCLLQLRLGARRFGLQIAVVHPIELLDEAFQSQRVMTGDR